MSILARLQSIDRRILYLLMAAVIAVPLLIKPGRHPHVILPEVDRAYRTLDTIAPGKIVIISTVWGAGTEAENGPQTENIMRHLFRNGTKFAVISWDPVGAEMTYRIGVDVAEKMGKRYKTDWVHMGYNPGPLYAVISGMAHNFQGQLKNDRFNTKLSDIPMTRRVKDHKQVGAVVEITPSGTVSYWIAYFTTPYQVPLIFCPTAVMAAEAYPFLDSGQLTGMLNGVIGAAQYETLLGMDNEPTYAAAASWALSSAHILIIVLIILGNLGYALSRRRDAQGRGGTRSA